MSDEVTREEAQKMSQAAYIAMPVSVADDFARLACAYLALLAERDRLREDLEKVWEEHEEIGKALASQSARNEKLEAFLKERTATAETAVELSKTLAARNEKLGAVLEAAARVAKEAWVRAQENNGPEDWYTLMCRKLVDAIAAVETK